MGAVTGALRADSFIKSHPKWKFTFVNHVTTNPFFVPTIYGAQDACSLLGCSYQWTGSTTCRRQPDGQCVQLGDLRQGGGHLVLSRRPQGLQRTDRQRRKRRASRCSPTTRTCPPVTRTNGWPTSVRISTRPGTRWASASSTSSGKATSRCSSPRPGQLNIQPRIDGATAAIKKFGAGKIKTSAIATGSQLNDEIAKIDAYYLGHKNVKGMFAVDAGSTQAVGQTVAKYGLRKKGVKAGGYDLTPTTLKLINTNQLDFTIDQQPYLQGWLPVLQLFFYKYSSGLVAPSNTNTGILFVTKSNVKPYLSTTTRYEGSSSAQKYPVS